jgi:L-lactate dehydrogenase complex protein LldF
MSTPFHKHIEVALANPSLQAALDGNAERRRTARETAFASLDADPDSLRRRAHAVRQDVIENLDAYVSAFTAQVQANGFSVHFAANAHEAVEHVLRIIQQAGAKRVVKSKTMVGEEIEINAALEKAGLRVVETDLGEWIVQLRGERPSHIITPAVHLRRGEVGQLFAEKLGMPYTEDIPTLTNAARRNLRAEFLAADVGISGVNFGVVENGMLCMLTNEGNGRMVTTLPPLHIALMGIERLLPTLQDLELMLSLLPRSATGQKMAVYTSLIHAPRQPDELDGAPERHLVLLDNGRRALRQSPLKESLYCIRCGACLNACPVFRELGGHAYVGAHGDITPYSGPIGSVISAGLFGVAEFGNLARASSLCGACQEACPVDIPLPELLLRVRAAGAEAPVRLLEAGKGNAAPPNVPLGLNWGLRGFSWLTASPRRFTAAQKLAGIFGKLAALRSPWLKMPAFTGWGLSRDFPQPAAKTFHERWQDSQSLRAPFAKQSQIVKSEIASAPEGHWRTRKDDGGSGTAVKDALVERFTQELELLGGQVVRCKPAELPGRLVALLKEQAIDRICAWDQSHLPPGLLEALQSQGVTVAAQADPQVRLGLTSAISGVAETGTLVLASGKGRPQSVSLLPEIHAAILQAGQLVQTLGGVNLDIEGASCVHLVSGPSRTADIEMTLTIGVHGPGQLIVFLID